MTGIQKSFALNPFVSFRHIHICGRYRAVQQPLLNQFGLSTAHVAPKHHVTKLLLSDGHLGGLQYLGSRDEASSAN